MVAALLTIVQGWIRAGMPPGQKTLGMFESSARVIGGILEFASIPGFLGNLEAFYESADTEGETWRSFVAAWWARHHDCAVGVAELWSIASESGIELGRDGSDRSQKIRLGRALSDHRDRVFGVATEQGTIQLRVEHAGTHNRAGQWRLRVVAQ